MFSEPLDTVVKVETPEGIELQLRAAGLHARLCAWMLDLLFRAAGLYAAGLLAGFLGVLGVSFWLISAFALEWLYPVVFELSRAGATPGKRMLGLKVVMDSGLPITPAASFIRNLLRAADFLPLFYSCGVVSMLVRADFKRLGDLAAGTLVVHAPKAPSHGAPLNVAAHAPAIALSVSARAALLQLASRATRINTERLDEVAALAAPACGVAAGTAASSALTQQVLGVAQWLLGNRSS